MATTTPDDDRFVASELCKPAAAAQAGSLGGLPGEQAPLGGCTPRQVRDKRARCLIKSVASAFSVKPVNLEA